jgi:hypothetical protein
VVGHRISRPLISQPKSMPLFRPRMPASPPPALAPGGPIPVMPRTGRPGTVTDTQLDILVDERFQPPAPLTRLQELSQEEAAAILAGLAYVRAAIRQVTGEDAPTTIENEALAAVLGDEGLGAAAVRWQQSGAPLPLKENAAFAAVRAVILLYWQPPA